MMPATMLDQSAGWWKRPGRDTRVMPLLVAVKLKYQVPYPVQKEKIGSPRCTGSTASTVTGPHKKINVPQRRIVKTITTDVFGTERFWGILVTHWGFFNMWETDLSNHHKWLQIFGYRKINNTEILPHILRSVPNNAKCPNANKSQGTWRHLMTSHHCTLDTFVTSSLHQQEHQVGAVWSTCCGFAAWPNLVETLPKVNALVAASHSLLQLGR